MEKKTEAIENATAAQILGYSLIGVGWILAGAFAAYAAAFMFSEMVPWFRIASGLSGLGAMIIGVNTIRALPPQDLHRSHNETVDLINDYRRTLRG